MPTLECFSEVSSESVNYKDGQDSISEDNSVTVGFEDDKKTIIKISKKSLYLLIKIAKIR